MRNILRSIVGLLSMGWGFAAPSPPSPRIVLHKSPSLRVRRTPLNGFGRVRFKTRGKHAKSAAQSRRNGRNRGARKCA